MQGKLPVPVRPTLWITVGQWPTALAVGAGGGCFGHFYPHPSFLSSFSLSLGDGPILTEILSQRAVKPKTTNQPNQTKGWWPRSQRSNLYILHSTVLDSVPSLSRRNKLMKLCEQDFKLFGRDIKLSEQYMKSSGQDIKSPEQDIRSSKLFCANKILCCLNEILSCSDKILSCPNKLCCADNILCCPNEILSCSDEILRVTL